MFLEVTTTIGGNEFGKRTIERDVELSEETKARIMEQYAD